MQSNVGRLFFGVVLVLAGGYFMAEQMGMAPSLSEIGWALFLGLVSAGFFVVYFSSGMKNWGVLFPACIMGGAAGVIWITTQYGAEEEGGALMMWSIALPFWAAWLGDRKANWWATIPGWALTVIGAIVLLESIIGGEMVGTLVLWSIALPFLVVYVRNRSHWWPLIPGGVLGIIGFIPLLVAIDGPGELAAGIFLAGLGLVFLVIYALYPVNWWAIIPGGILLSLGVSTGLIYLPLEQAWVEKLIEFVSLGGMALTFGVLWSLRARYPTAWAKFPAVGLGLFALLAVGLGSNKTWPVVLIGLGLWLLLRSRARGAVEEA